MPKTSAAPMGDYYEVFKQELDKGNDIIFKEKIDKKIVISKHFRITISARYLSGDINYLCYQIKAIINH